MVFEKQSKNNCESENLPYFIGAQFRKRMQKQKSELGMGHAAF